MTGGTRRGPSSRAALLTALAVDSTGTGMFLPIALLYLVRVVGLSTTTAGLVVASATFVALIVPAVAGVAVDRFGARIVVLAAFGIQGLGMTAQLFADSAWTAFAAVLCTTLGQRAFWASVFTLLADLAGDVAKEPVFAVANSMQSGGFALGAATGSLLMTADSTAVYRTIVVVNAVSYVLGGALVGFGVRAPKRNRARSATGSGYRAVLGDRHFRGVLAAYVALPLAVNAGTVALPVYLVQRLALPAWLPGAVGLTIAVAVTVFRRRAVRLVRDRNRARTLRTAAMCCLLYFLGIAGLVFAPVPLRIPLLICSLVPYIGSNLVQNAVATALVEAMAPVEARGRYLAVSQYCWAGTGVLAPVMVSLYSVSDALPWLLAAAVAAGSAGLFGGLAGRLPAGVVYRPDAVFEV